MRAERHYLILCPLALFVGCGGHGAEVVSQELSKVSVEVEWPSRSRFIHQSADRLEVSAKVNGIAVRVDSDETPFLATIQRPQGAGVTSEVSLENLPTGPITFTVQSFRKDKSTALGKAVVPVVLVPGDNPNLEFVLESQTSTVEVTLDPSGSIRRVGQVMNLSASSKQGIATVIDSLGEFTYTLSDPTKLRLIGNSQVEVLAEGTSTITARERGNDGTGKTGTITVRTDDFEESAWSLTDTGLIVSQSGFPVFSSTPAYKHGVAYFGYGGNLLSVGPSGSWAQNPVTGLEPDVVRIELIGVGPSEELYARGLVQTGAFTFSVRDIYRISSGFAATRVANSLSGPVAIAHTFCVTRSGRFGSVVPSFDNWDWTMNAGPVASQITWSFTGAMRRPSFQLLDSGGALIWNKVDGLTTGGGYFVANLALGTVNSAQVISPPAGYTEVTLGAMNQEGYWLGVAKGGSGLPSIVGRYGQILHVSEGEGAVNPYATPSPSGICVYPIYAGGVPQYWEVYNPSTNQSSALNLGTVDLTALGIRTVVSGGVMVAEYQGKVAILRRSN